MGTDLGDAGAESVAEHKSQDYNRRYPIEFEYALEFLLISNKD